MAREQWHLRDGRWLVDWQAVEKLERASWRASLRNSAEFTTEGQLDRGAIGVPRIVTLDTNYDALNARADAQVSATLRDWEWNLSSGRLSGAELRQQLISDQAETSRDNERFLVRMRRVSHDNMERTRSAEFWWGVMKSGAEVTRDTSAEILVIGGTVLAAPVVATLAAGGSLAAGATTAAGVLGAGSLMKGVGSYQDKGSATGAIIEATGTFAFALIPGGKEASATRKVTVFAAKVAVGTAKGLAEAREEGKFGEALTNAVVDGMVEVGAGKVIEAEPIEKLLKKLTVPVSVAVKKRREIGRALVRQGAESAVKSAGKAGAESMKRLREDVRSAVADDGRPFENLTAAGGDVNIAVVDAAIARATP